MAESVSGPKRGLVSWWPIWAAVSLPCLDIAVQAYSVNLSFVLLFAEVPLLAVWSAASLVAIVLAVRSILRKAWRQALVTLVFPSFVLFSISHFDAVKNFCDDAADTIHFVLFYPKYENRITALPMDGYRLVVFDLGGMVWGGRGIAYDETDQITLEKAQRSLDWNERARNTVLVCGYYARRMPGPADWTRHWYFVSFGC